MRLEGHRLDVEASTLGVHADEIAGDVLERCAGADRRGCRLGRILVEGPWLVVDGQRPQRPGLGLGVLADRVTIGVHEQQLTRAEPAATDRL